MLCEAKDWALVAQEEAWVVEALASNVMTKAIEPFRVRKEYHLKVLEANRDAF